MRQFTRTLGGKSLIFALCAFLTVLMGASVIGIVAMASSGYYTISEESMVESIVGDDALAVADDLMKRAEIYISAKGGDGSVVVVGEEDEATNLAYEIYDPDGNMVARSGSRARITDDIPVAVYMRPFGEEQLPHTIKVYVDGSLAARDNIYYHVNLFNITYGMRYVIFIVAIVSLIMAVVCFIVLMNVSGKRPGSEELHPGLLNGVPYDLLLFIAAFPVSFLVIGYMFFILPYQGTAICVTLGIVVALAVFSVMLGLCMSAAVRLKEHMLFRNTVIYIVLRWIGSMFSLFFNTIRNMGLVPKTVVILLLLVMSEVASVYLLLRSGLMFLAFNVARLIIIVPFVMHLAIALKKLSMSGEALASGDLSYHTDTANWTFLPDCRRHGMNLNSIAAGMNVAVEARLRSERMKTELITNVSHDLKTPLTSMINYAGLISSEPCDNPKITEYSEVLVRQSDRLKRLIEDLVEASKASTGNLEVNLAPCDASVFVSQALGEYEEKLSQSSLTLITSLPDSDVRIMADGRRMWRIFDNLMNNICKYAQPGTRVYLSLTVVDSCAEFTFKNTSAAPLNMSEEELMERFTRGDASRNSGIEGNGLGLSIAKSMAELQNGTLGISIDGDLFKAVLRFPVI